MNFPRKVYLLIITLVVSACGICGFYILFSDDTFPGVLPSITKIPFNGNLSDVPSATLVQPDEARHQAKTDLIRA